MPNPDAVYDVLPRCSSRETRTIGRNADGYEIRECVRCGERSHWRTNAALAALEDDHERV